MGNGAAQARQKGQAARKRAFLAFPGPGSLYLVLPLVTTPGLFIICRIGPFPVFRLPYVPEERKCVCWGDMPHPGAGQAVTQRFTGP